MFHLKEGDACPEFKTLNQHNEEVNSKSFLGKKMVIYFYPKDDTPGCTAEACDLRDNIDKFEAANYVIFGVSPDGVKSHAKFATKYNLPFNLLADETHSIAELFGVWGYKKFMGKEYDGIHRTTFVFDEQHKITQIITKVETKAHTAQIL